MKKKVIFALSGLAFLAVQNVSGAFAQRVSTFKASNFLQICKNSQAAGSAGICDAYINGIADSVALTKIYAKHNGDDKVPAAFCIAPAVSGKEMKARVISWMDSHPEKLAEPVGAVIYTALHAAYPCNSK